MTSNSQNQISIRSNEKVLIYGIGNVARMDDGLGIRLIEMFDGSGRRGNFAFESHYQLNAEDALLIADFDLVIFVDATHEVRGDGAFSLRKLEVTRGIAFSTHAMSFGAVLSLCEELKGHHPRAYVLTIPGYAWDFNEALSPQAQKNLRTAFEFIHSLQKASVQGVPENA